jgi:tetratricopeptide (TPR) repeat protein
LTYWNNPIGTTLSANPQKALFDEAYGHLRAGRPERATEVCMLGIDKFPNDANIFCLAAQGLITLKHLKNAREHIDIALEKFPMFANAHELHGDLLLLEGQFEKSIDVYRHVQHLQPKRTHVDAKIQRANELIQSLVAGVANQQPDFSFTEELDQAQQFKRDGEPQKAEDIYRTILRKNPNHSEAMRLLAAVAATHNRYDDAEILLLRAIEKSPNFSRAWLDLSKMQLELGKYSDALKSAEKLVELTPGIAESLVALANTQAQCNFAERAIETYNRAIEISPSHPGALSGLAHQLKTVGRQDDAIAAHRQNIQANPNNTEPYWNLANLKTFRFEPSEVETMERLLQDSNLEDLSVVQLCNALGLEYEGRKDYGRAFDYFERCNQTRRQSEKYDPVGHELLINQIINVFNAEFIDEQRGSGNPDRSPILVVGLPRSGSTLIEQILASHSQVEGTHELSDLAQMVQDLKRNSPRGTHFPENMRENKVQSWSDIGDQYLQRTKKYSSGTPRFIDKNPNNFIYCGLVQLILPNAKIINARRHPLDSSFGSFKQLFASGQPFSYDLCELGEYYLEYQRLMDHWHQVIPDQVLDVNYEDVVADLDTEVRRILDYCELPFEESCLRFHETDRAVKTASSEQVRKPIYSSSVNLWKNYEPYIDELIEILEPLLLQLPVDQRPALTNEGINN